VGTLRDSSTTLKGVLLVGDVHTMAVHPVNRYGVWSISHGVIFGFPAYPSAQVALTDQVVCFKDVSITVYPFVELGDLQSDATHPLKVYGSPFDVHAVTLAVPACPDAQLALTDQVGTLRDFSTTV